MMSPEIKLDEEQAASFLSGLECGRDDCTEDLQKYDGSDRLWVSCLGCRDRVDLKTVRITYEYEEK